MKRAMLALLLMTAACDEPGSVTGPSTRPQLRIVNTSGTRFSQLSALFPQDQVSFGDVGPGATTDYRSTSGGVYRYAAWQYQRGGAQVVEPVIDWVGESPMEGRAFTYTINVRTFEDGIARIVLTNVTRDR
jgi:hypothetical protein